ncbi:unnamed protein product [Lathyrus sativus]|nr:unnamed protein product [Lathyrus sativus]
MQIHCIPGDWQDELNWLMQNTKGKGARAAVIKMAASETIYELWMIRNKNFFDMNEDTTIVGKKVIDALVYRGWNTKKIRKYIAILMLDGG